MGGRGKEGEDRDVYGDGEIGTKMGREIGTKMGREIGTKMGRERGREIER